MRTDRGTGCDCPALGAGETHQARTTAVDGCGLLCDQWRSRRSGGLDRVPERIENGLIAKTATEVVSLLREGRISSHELLDALEQRIAAVDVAVGALPTLCA